MLQLCTRQGRGILLGRGMTCLTELVYRGAEELLAGTTPQLTPNCASQLPSSFCPRNSSVEQHRLRAPESLRVFPWGRLSERLLAEPFPTRGTPEPRRWYRASRSDSAGVPEATGRWSRTIQRPALVLPCLKGKLQSKSCSESPGARVLSPSPGQVGVFLFLDKVEGRHREHRTHEKAGFGQPRGEKAQGSLTISFSCLMGGLWSR